MRRQRRQQVVHRPSRTARRPSRARARAIAASCCAGVRPARSGATSPSAIGVLEAGDAHHEELVEVRRGDRRELEALEQRRRGVGGFFEHALVEREPRQLAVEEQLGSLRRASPAHDATPAAGDHDAGARTPRSSMSARAVRGQPLHRQVAGALELEHPGARPAARSVTSCTFCRCSASSALARRRIAASLLTTHAILAVERHVRQVRLLRQRRGGGSGRCSRRRAMSSRDRPKISAAVEEVLVCL